VKAVKSPVVLYDEAAACDACDRKHKARVGRLPILNTLYVMIRIVFHSKTVPHRYKSTVIRFRSRNMAAVAVDTGLLLNEPANQPSISTISGYINVIDFIDN
jgi:hypothetical protein